MAKKHIQTHEDTLLRAQVADSILYGMSLDPVFAEPKEFGKWQRKHKDLLLQLFGGQGITNLARVVAWCRREALGVRRDDNEILCLIADAYKRNDMPMPLRTGFESLGLFTITDVLRAAMIERTFAKALLEPAPQDGLDGVTNKLGV